MVEGTLQNKGLHLNTYAFSDRDFNLLLKVLTNKFKLKCLIHYQNKTKPHNKGLGTKYALITKNLVKHKHTDMLYKISCGTPSTLI